VGGEPTDVDMSCGVVTCTDGVATSRSGSQCCNQAGSADVIPVGRLIDQQFCQAVQCSDSMAASMDTVGNCGCGIGGDSGGAPGDAPTPTPGPSPEGGIARR
jgi:hypothetical protein